MKMVIKGIERIEKYTYVVGNTDIGNIKGVWHDSEIPVLNSIYFFELLIREIDRHEISIVNTDHIFPCVSSNGEQVFFRGICEEIDDMYAVRFAPDWIEMIEIKNDDFVIHKGNVISFSVNCDSIFIYPYRND